MTDEELIDALASGSSKAQIALLEGIAVCQIRNVCPPGWGVRIIDCGVNFYYDDGTSETDGPRAINLLGPDGTAIFSSKKSDGCVNRMFVAMNVYVPGEGSKMFKDDIKDCPADMCMSSRASGIGPKKNVVKGDGLFETLQIGNYS